MNVEGVRDEKTQRIESLSFQSTQFIDEKFLSRLYEVTRRGGRITLQPEGEEEADEFLYANREVTKC